MSPKRSNTPSTAAAAPAGSVEPSRSSCLNVIVASGEVLDGSGSSDGVAVGPTFDDAATGLPAGEPAADGEAETTVGLRYEAVADE